MTPETEVERERDGLARGLKDALEYIARFPGSEVAAETRLAVAQDDIKAYAKRLGLAERDLELANANYRRVLGEYDALCTRLAEVERERDQWRDSGQHHGAEAMRLAGERDAVLEANQTLTAALERYGWHDGDCPQCDTQGVVVFDAPRFRQPCTCGLDQARGGGS